MPWWGVWPPRGSGAGITPERLRRLQGNSPGEGTAGRGGAGQESRGEGGPAGSAGGAFAELQMWEANREWRDALLRVLLMERFLTGRQLSLERW